MKPVKLVNWKRTTVKLQICAWRRRKNKQHVDLRLRPRADTSLLLHSFSWTSLRVSEVCPSDILRGHKDSNVKNSNIWLCFRQEAIMWPAIKCADDGIFSLLLHVYWRTDGVLHLSCRGQRANTHIITIYKYINNTHHCSRSSSLRCVCLLHWRNFIETVHNFVCLVLLWRFCYFGSFVNVLVAERDFSCLDSRQQTETIGRCQALAVPEGAPPPTLAAHHHPLHDRHHVAFVKRQFIWTFSRVVKQSFSQSGL